MKDSQKPQPLGGYDPTFFRELVEIEERHFWFRSRNRLIRELARKICSRFVPGALVLEVGCGTGNVLRVLCEAYSKGSVVGMELWLDGLRMARGRSRALLVQGDVRTDPFGRRFDLIGMFDVLEHISEETETLLALRDLLSPEGRLMLTVPAHQSLWSYFDEAAFHCRRYAPDELRRKLIDAGFEVEFLSQFMASLFPVIWLVRKARGLARQNQEKTSAKQLADKEFQIVPILNSLLAMILNLEVRWLSAGRRLPIGTSIIAVARRLPASKGAP